MERNSTKDANHIKRVFGIAQSLLGNTFSNKELQEAVKSINSNKPIIGSSTPAASVVQPTITATAVPVATTSTQAQAPINSTNNYDPKAALEDLTKRGKLKELTVNGVTSSIFDYEDRKFVVVPIHDVDVPFYLSSGQAGKKNVPAGKWYPVFGIGPDGWINKGTQADIVNHYGYDTFKKVAEKLDEKLGDIRGWQTAEIGLSTENEFFSAINKGLGEPGIPHSNSGNELPGKIGRIFQKMTENAALKKQQILPSAAPVVPPVTSVPAATVAPINPITATATPAPAPVSAPAPVVPPVVSVPTVTITPVAPPVSSVPAVPVAPINPVATIAPSIPINSTKPLKDRILSFDIETSSLDPGNGFIWQTGFASYDNNGNLTSSGEYFAPSDNASVSDLQDRLTTSEFGKKQHEAGRFNEYLASQKRQQGDVTKSLLNAMSGDKDVLLIQNSNFERRWIESHAFSGTAEAGDVAALSDKSAYSYFKRGTQTKVGSLYPSPEILGLRNEASAKYYKFLQTGDAALFDEAAKLHSDIMARYATELFDTTSGKYKVVDLMDITKSVFAKAAEEGLIDKRHVTIGTSQEFLARMFNLGEETHLAPGDSKQAMSIFLDYLMPLYKDLRSGNISDNTKRIFKQISDAQPTEATHQYMRSLTRAFDEAQSQAGYRQSIPIGNSKIEKLEFIDNRTGSIVKSSREFQTGRRYLKAEDSAAIIEDVSSRYRNIPTAGFSAEQVEQEVERLPTPIQKQEFVETLSREVRENKDKLPNLRDADINAGSLKKWFKNNRGKSIALGLAALGAIAIADSDNGSAEEIKTTKAAKRQMTQSIDNSLRIYSKPKISIDPDHGSGFADWNERTRHHEYF